MANVNSTGFDEVDPASRYDTFIIAPKKAAMPVRAPKISPRPTTISPNVMSGPNQVWALLLMSRLRKSRTSHS